ncbi:hypothetical protein Aab01nite_68980 [Paractinoplanes abujensis]|nr:hypothetical protein Aab01nite_68980 [Actinoplanes abujensis]
MVARPEGEAESVGAACLEGEAELAGVACLEGETESVGAACSEGEAESVGAAGPEGVALEGAVAVRPAAAGAAGGGSVTVPRKTSVTCHFSSGVRRDAGGRAARSGSRADLGG